MASTSGLASRHQAVVLYGCLCLLLTVGLSTRVAHARRPALHTSGSGSRTDRQAAISSIPFPELKPSAARRIQAVVSDPSVYRRLPMQSIECDPELFVFLVRNPEVVVDIWTVMGVTQLTMNRTGEFTFSSADGAGTESNFELVYGTPGLHLYYGTGSYEGPLFKKSINGRCVILLQSEFAYRHGQPIVICRLDVFLQIDRGAVDAIAKTVHPLFGKTADVNFSETAGFFAKLSDAAEQNSEGMQYLGGRLVRVSPTVRANFVRVAAGVASRSTDAASPPSPEPTGRENGVRPAAAYSYGDRQPFRESRYPPQRMPAYR